MPSLRELLGIDRASASQRRARALVKADRELLDALVSLRKAQGLTQKAVADRIGVSQATIASFESYDNDPKLSTVRRYAHAVEALVAHAVEHDDGQLATTEHELIVTMTPVDKSMVVRPSSQQRPVRASIGEFTLDDLALAA